MTGYDLSLFFEKSVNYFWNASISQVYRDLGTLEKEGYVSAHLEVQEGRPDKKIYTITQSGKDAFLDWLSSFPSNLTGPVRNEFQLRVFFGSHISLKELRFQFQRLIKERQETIRFLEEFKGERHKFCNEFTDQDKFFWNLTGKMGYIVAKASIEGAEECIKEIDEILEQISKADDNPKSFKS